MNISKMNENNSESWLKTLGKLGVDTTKLGCRKTPVLVKKKPPTYGCQINLLKKAYKNLKLCYKVL